MPSVISNVLPTLTKPPPTDTENPLHELFPSSSTNVNVGNTTVTNLDRDLETAFLSSNEQNSSTNTNKMLSNDRILALFNTPQASTTTTATATGMNIRPATIQPSNSKFESKISKDY